MSVDPTDPETRAEPGEENGAGVITEDEESPEADVAEQHADLRQEQDDPLTRIDPSTANEADAAEQSRVVQLDEDDYR
ncbi:hypothetical protein I3F58_17375 [Streptomyces sp. MUM 203J]|uniref:hypothetical protein n=1 Tax=Streptomyces sp. MUM 203J TaxID=2791990 RepID=UPI001F04C71E|nr:hypothetical protein [Streptomyces sp. MUM 203J]MCH0541298.1 hypothetical protein [Streptomyces sp. MUM 203J]